VSPEAAEARYYALYREYMDAEHSREYSKPIVQQNIRRQTWAKLTQEIEAEAQQSLRKDVEFLKQRCEQLTRDRDQAKSAYNSLLRGMVQNIEQDAHA
jgi:hypothetical protein